MQEDENSFLPSARSLLIHVRVRASVLVRCIAVRVTRAYDALTYVWFICLHEIDLRLFCLRVYISVFLLGTCVLVRPCPRDA